MLGTVWITPALHDSGHVLALFVASFTIMRHGEGEAVRASFLAISAGVLGGTLAGCSQVPGDPGFV